MEDDNPLITKRRPTLLGRPAFQRTRTDLFFEEEISNTKGDGTPRKDGTPTKDGSPAPREEGTPRKEGSSLSQKSAAEMYLSSPVKTPAPPVPTVTSDEEYDTDLEDDGSYLLIILIIQVLIKSIYNFQQELSLLAPLRTRSLKIYIKITIIFRLS